VSLKIVKLAGNVKRSCVHGRETILRVGSCIAPCHKQHCMYTFKGRLHLHFRCENLVSRKPSAEIEYRFDVHLKKRPITLDVDSMGRFDVVHDSKNAHPKHLSDLHADLNRPAVLRCAPLIGLGFY
jgi:hypothetical protein